MSTQTAPGASVSSPQPQTTLEPPGGPFIRYAEEGYRPQYDATGVVLGNQVTNPLVAIPGYVSRFRAKFAVTSTATGGVLPTSATVDYPYNCVSLLQLNDADNNPIIVGPGFEVLYLIPLFSGGYGLLGAANIANMPSFTAITAASGAFVFETALPLEMMKGYGLLSMANASVLPNLVINTNTLSYIYTGGGQTGGTAPTTGTTSLEVRIGADFYWLPQGVNIAPPGLGSSRQWIITKANPSIGSGSYVNVQFPRPGGYIDTIIVELRDSTGLRVDLFPDPISLWVDGVAMVNNRPLSQVKDDIYNQFGGITRPLGVLAFTRKNSLSQLMLGLLDTGEQYLSTNPGTLIEIGGTWPTIANSPAQLTVITGQVVPSAALIQGLPQQ